MFETQNSTRKKSEEIRIARELGEIFSGEPSEYFGEDDTPTSTFAAVTTPPPLPAIVKKVTTLRDFMPRRTELSHENVPIYVLSTGCIEKYFLDYKVFPTKICIHKSRFQELVTSIVNVHREPFKPNLMPFLHGIQLPRCEYIEIVFNNHISEYAVICS